MNAVGYRDRIAGTGDLSNPNTMPAYQRIFHADRSCDEVQIGTLSTTPSTTTTTSTA